MSARDLPLSSTGDLPLADILAMAAGPVARVDPQARVEGGVLLGEGCVVRCGAYLPRGTKLEEDVTVGPNAVFVDAEPGERGTVVQAGARIGAGAVIYAGLVIGSGARVLPGAVVMQSVAPGATVAAHAAAVLARGAAARADQAGFPA